jgi:Big-like domain-containing protein
VTDAESGQVVAGTVGYAATTRTATWTPAPSLPPERRVTVTVTTGVKDVAGNALDAPYSFGFQVREMVAPFIVSYSPPNGSTVPIGAWPTVQFSERMGSGSLAAGMRMVDSASRGVRSVGLFYDTLTNVVTMIPGAFKSFNPYTFLIDERVLDLAGNGNATLLEFTVRFGEWTLPKIVSTIPENGATGVPINPTITIALDAPVYGVNDYEPRFTWRRNGQIVGMSYSYSLDASRTRFILRPLGDLTPASDYTVTFVHFFTDSKGVRHEEQVSLTFRTAG